MSFTAADAQPEATEPPDGPGPERPGPDGPGPESRRRTGLYVALGLTAAALTTALLVKLCCCSSPCFNSVV